jgi:crotonobetainyl-CoA:carnitine CoA-transferase CaiB-like acyl-CoA transferase
LQRAGVTAAPVLANWQLLADPHLFARGFYVPISHPVAGVYPYPSWPWRFSRTPAAVTRYAPLFGEHNSEILRELGLNEAAVQSLYDRKVTADTPILA